MPACIENIGGLIRLGMSGCRLNTLPEWLGKLKKLKVLRLVNNQLSELPESFGNLTNLQELWLSRNRLTTVPSQLANAIGMERLWVDNNGVAEFCRIGWSVYPKYAHYKSAAIYCLDRPSGWVNCGGWRIWTFAAASLLRYPNGSGDYVG